MHARLGPGLPVFSGDSDRSVAAERRVAYSCGHSAGLAASREAKRRTGFPFHPDEVGDPRRMGRNSPASYRTTLAVQGTGPKFTPYGPVDAASPARAGRGGGLVPRWKAADSNPRSRPPTL